MLCAGSAVSDTSEVGVPSCFATACAVNGMSCISPRAPDGLTAPMSKLLSWRIRPSATAGSTGAVRRFDGDRPAGLRQREPVAAHAARDEHRGVRQPDLKREARGQRAIGRIGRELVHAQQEGARAVRIVPGHQHRGGAHHLAVGERQHLLARVGGVVQRGDAARQRGGIVAQRERGKLAVERRRPGGGAVVFGLRILARRGGGTAQPVMRAAPA